MTGRILEITFLLVALYLVVSNAIGFSSVVGSLSRAYIGAVQTLQGR